MNYGKVVDVISQFLVEKTTGTNGGVIGLSGGVDSTVVAYLSKNALGKDRVYGLILPFYDNEHKDDGIEVAETLGIEHDVVSIKPMFESFLKTGQFKKEVTRENLMARIRMVELYGASNDRNMLVLGTTNKSEMETGHATKYGDHAADLEPIGDLYKTEVWELAKYIGVSQKIISKTPTADLTAGETDESVIGMDYFTLDKILKGETDGIDPSKIERVDYLHDISQHKREMPPVAVIER